MRPKHGSPSKPSLADMMAPPAARPSRGRERLLPRRVKVAPTATRKPNVAARDGLTGAMNRASFTSHAVREIGQHRSIKSSVSLLFVDVDHFKRINDTYGHETGDRVLKRIIRLARCCLRSGDTVARWGGEEFVVLLPATDLNGALLIAEKIRYRIEVEQFDALATGLRVTVSIGCAEISNGEGLDELVARADRALYEAKHQGRNQTAAA